MHRLGARHHYGPGLAYGINHNYGQGPSYYPGRQSHHHNECCCFIF